MTLQQPRTTKAFAANFALARQCVRSNVHFESAERRVGFFTVFTGKMLLNLGAAVELLVFGQAAKCGVALAAAVALVSGEAVRTIGWRNGGGHQLIWFGLCVRYCCRYIGLFIV